MREDILARGEDPADFPILNSKPELYRDLLWIWEGFMVLSTFRQIGMSGPQPIAVIDINGYCQLKDLHDPEDREDFLHYIMQMDLAFLADWRARNPPPKGGKGGGGRRGGGNFQ